MKTRVQVTFRRGATSELAREVAQQKFEKLASQLPHIARCHVVLDRPVNSHHKGATITASVDISGAGIPLYAEASHSDARVAVREAFERAETQARRARANHDRTRRATIASELTANA